MGLLNTENAKQGNETGTIQENLKMRNRKKEIAQSKQDNNIRTI